MRPKSVADEQRQLALAIEFSKRHAVAEAEATRQSRVGSRTLVLFCISFIFTKKLRQQPKSEDFI